MYVGSYVVPGLDLADGTWPVFFFFSSGVPLIFGNDERSVLI